MELPLHAYFKDKIIPYSEAKIGVLTHALNYARLMAMELNHTPESLTQVTLDLLRADGYHRDIYIRPLAFKSDEIIGVKLHDLHDELSIVAVPFDRYVTNDTNAHVTVSSWRRIDDNAIPARGKISGAYA